MGKASRFRSQNSSKYPILFLRLKGLSNTNRRMTMNQHQERHKGVAGRDVQGEVGPQIGPEKNRSQVKKKVKCAYVFNESNCLGIREESSSTSGKISVSWLPEMDVNHL